MVSTVLGRDGETEKETDKKTDGHRVYRQTDVKTDLGKDRELRHTAMTKE